MFTKTQPWKNWKHITKLDPDKYISPDDLDIIVGSGTDAIMISGTQNITNTNVGQLIKHLENFKIPKILEPATPDAVLDGVVDFIFVPLVLNAGDLKWIVGKHKDWILNYKIKWEKVIPEAYIVMNPESAVAKLTKSKTDLTSDEVIAYAQYAEKYLRLPIVYMEYSGTYGDPNMVKRVRESLNEASLFYGGGIESRVNAAEMMRYADVIVVGNVVYTDIDKFIETIP
jgi:phosphoglycerol geranylgeranyltransferase